MYQSRSGGKDGQRSNVKLIHEKKNLLILVDLKVIQELFFYRSVLLKHWKNKKPHTIINTQDPHTNYETNHRKGITITNK